MLRLVSTPFFPLKNELDVKKLTRASPKNASNDDTTNMLVRLVRDYCGRLSPQIWSQYVKWQLTRNALTRFEWINNEHTQSDGIASKERRTDCHWCSNLSIQFSSFVSQKCLLHAVAYAITLRRTINFIAYKILPLSLYGCLSLALSLSVLLSLSITLPV